MFVRTVLGGAVLAALVAGCSSGERRPAAPPPPPELPPGAAAGVPEIPPDPAPATALHARPRATIVIGRENPSYTENPPAAEPPARGVTQVSRTVVQTNHYYGGYYPYAYGPAGGQVARGAGEPGTGGAAPRPASRPPTTVGGDWAAPKDPGPGMIKNWQAR
ncbi:MAG: hypothetical protein JNL38_11960 [Myxococcales bacterium]|nr:hypothetical protein [Myxococcales bacterium]